MAELTVPPAEPCNFCGTSIIWVRSAASGSRMPLDAAPSEHGNVLLSRGPGGTVLGGVASTTGAAAARRAGQPTYQHHAVHCPHKARWNKPAARAGAARRQDGQTS